MEATAGAAPVSGAGTGSGQNGSPSSSSKASNSASSPPQPQRQTNAAPPSSSPPPKEATGEDKQTRKAAPSKQQDAGDDDPDFDFGERGKFKRSRVVQDFQRMQASQRAEAKRAAEHEQRANALTEKLKKLGFDVDQFDKDPESAVRAVSQAILQKQIEEATLPPEVLAQRRAEAERDEYKARADEFEAAQKQEQERVAVETRAQDFAQQINTALEQADLPRNPKTIARMAEIMLAAARKGSRLPHDELAKRVAAHVHSDVDHHLSSYGDDGAALAKRLGPKAVEALRKHLASQTPEEKFFPTEQTKTRRAPTQKVPQTSHPNGYWTLDQWNQHQAKLRANKR